MVTGDVVAAVSVPLTTPDALAIEPDTAIVTPPPNPSVALERVADQLLASL